jgi:hypothetical protein
MMALCRSASSPPPPPVRTLAAPSSTAAAAAYASCGAAVGAATATAARCRAAAAWAQGNSPPRTCRLVRRRGSRARAHIMRAPCAGGRPRKRDGACGRCKHTACARKDAGQLAAARYLPLTREIRQQRVAWRVRSLDRHGGARRGLSRPIDAVVGVDVPTGTPRHLEDGHHDLRQAGGGAQAQPGGGARRDHLQGRLCRRRRRGERLASRPLASTHTMHSPPPPPLPAGRRARPASSRRCRGSGRLTGTSHRAA